VDPGDTVIIVTYHDLDEADAQKVKPSLVYVDGDNRIVRTAGRALMGVPA
jgi:aspartate 1-decarboxylase